MSETDINQEVKQSQDVKQTQDVKQSQEIKDKPSEMFFVDKTVPKESSKEKSKASSDTTNFIGKGANRHLDKSWNIKFTVGSELFKNIIEFIETVGYDTLMIFRKKEVSMLIIDKMQTHAISIKINRIEFIDYIVKDLKDDDDEKVVYIDTSIITDELSINEKYPIDVYIDTLELNRFYIVNAKEIVGRQLEALNTTDAMESIVNKNKSMQNSIINMILGENYQKVIVNQIPFANLIKSMTKKTSKDKDSLTIATLCLRKHELDFVIEKDIQSTSVVLSGEDILVYPIREDEVRFNLEFFNKFGKLKLTYAVILYISGGMPLVLETKLGGGKVVIHYLIAPRVDEDN